MKNHPDLPKNAPQWLRDADIEYPRVEIINGVVIWHDGKWRSGLWHGGLWHGGKWHGGEWLSGKWYNGKWRSGLWYDGKWHGGEWYNGIWHDGEWHGGLWHGGTWHGGVWRGGVWRSGVWHGGQELAARAYWMFVEINGQLKIGCKIKTVEEWDEWFENSNETFQHSRNSEQFQLIKKAFYKFYAKTLNT